MNKKAILIKIIALLFVCGIIVGLNIFLIEHSDVVENIVSSGLKERDQNQIGLKWPLSKATIIGGDFKLKKDEEEIIKSQLNVKQILPNLDMPQP